MSDGRVLLILGIAIAILVVAANVPLVTGVLLPVLTGLLVASADQWRRSHTGRTPTVRRTVRRVTRFVSPPSAPRSFAAGQPAVEQTLLLAATACLLLLGLLMVGSAASKRPGGLTDLGGAYLARFAVYATLGLAAMYVLSRHGVEAARQATPILLLVSFVMNVAVLVPGLGVEVNGARRWLGAGPLEFQPAELMKLSLVLYGCQLLVTARVRERPWPRTLSPYLLVCGAGIVLIAVQPDLGTALVLSYAVAALLMSAGVPVRTLALLAAAASAVVILFALAESYRRDALTSFIDPWGEPAGRGFQAVQSQIAIGSGGLWGRGFGESVQKAWYLPESHTNFMLAVIGEELGAVGVLFVLALYGAVAYAGCRIALASDDPYVALLATGVTVMILSQATLSAFAVVGLAPATSVGLPLVSYGSSNLLITLACIGLLLNLTRGTRSGRVSPRVAVGGGATQLMRRRIALVASVFVGLLALSGFRAVWLGTVQAADMRERARAQQIANFTIPARRGTIRDRHGFPLAESQPAADVFATPALIERPLIASRLIATVVGISQAQVLRALTRRAPIVVVAPKVSRDVAERAERLPIPGIVQLDTYRRVRPRKSLAAAVIGRLDARGAGASGIEQARDAWLRGRDGAQRVVQNAFGAPLSVRRLAPVAHGRDVRLTLDAGLQGRVESVLADEGYRTRSAAAVAVLLDAADGDVLVVGGWSRAPKTVERAPGNVSPKIPGIALEYEPGSPFALVAVAGALEDRRIAANQWFRVPPALEVGDRVVRDDRVNSVTLKTGDVAAGRSNVGTLLIARRLGVQRFHHWVQRFGFGRATGIDLPGERSGDLPRNARYGLSGIGGLAVGRNHSVTALQLAAVYGAVANGGILRSPRIVASPAEAASATRVVSPSTAARLREMLRNSGGVADATPRIDQRSGEYSAKRYIASFAGVAPAANPRLAVVVLLVEPTARSSRAGAAAPAARRIVRFAVPYLGLDLP